MDISCQVVAFYAAELEPSSTFWAGVLGGTVDVEDDWHMVIDGDGVPRVAIQLAPDHVPPDWPNGEQRSRCTLTCGSTSCPPRTTRSWSSERSCSRRHRTWTRRKDGRCTQTRLATRSASVGTGHSTPDLQSTLSTIGPTA